MNQIQSTNPRVSSEEAMRDSQNDIFKQDTLRLDFWAEGRSSTSGFETVSGEAAWGWQGSMCGCVVCGVGMGMGEEWAGQVCCRLYWWAIFNKDGPESSYGLFALNSHSLAEVNDFLSIHGDEVWPHPEGQGRGNTSLAILILRMYLFNLYLLQPG